MSYTLADISKKMRSIDFAMLSTRAADGQIGSRPMSNNREVDYDGDAYFFSTDDTRMAEDIGADPRVGLTYQGSSGIIGQRPFFLAVEGNASLIRDRAQFEEHKTKDIDKWFPQGIDTPGLVLIKVSARRVHYWDGEDEGEVKLG
jgi:general stress protein 26